MVAPAATWMEVEEDALWDNLVRPILARFLVAKMLRMEAAPRVIPCEASAPNRTKDRLGVAEEGGAGAQHRGIPSLTGLMAELQAEAVPAGLVVSLLLTACPLSVLFPRRTLPMRSRK